MFERPSGKGAIAGQVRGLTTETTDNSEIVPNNFSANARPMLGKRQRGEDRSVRFSRPEIAFDGSATRRTGSNGNGHH
ncbi:hypothetical protein JJD41_13710 [Oxynema sp. CENA135]|uniref:hypothetical protein n=1 Tax=Oxynema sp. CENA135 TaxID=984206 RepID=UPI0019099E4A|nr:hypothetical protein [Oxynema sp. CENA135]MBK4730909.1 hypothetical protein [Oxynema sp. CENA135]